MKLQFFLTYHTNLHRYKILAQIRISALHHRSHGLHAHLTAPDSHISVEKPPALTLPPVSNGPEQRPRVIEITDFTLIDPNPLCCPSYADLARMHLNPSLSPPS